MIYGDIAYVLTENVYMIHAIASCQSLESRLDT